MLDKIFSIGLDVFAFVTPISIAVTNIVFFPLAALWLFGARWTWPRWAPRWGWPERFFLIYLGTSLLSALAGLNVSHSLREIFNKDFYIVIAIVLVALVGDREKNERMIAIFMIAGVATAVWGLIQRVIGVNIVDKSDPYFFHLPTALVHWPRPMINLLAMINGRVIGTRGHPLAYAECLLFNWAYAICFLLSARGNEWIKWFLSTALIGAALLVSQSRGPWIAAAIILILAVMTSVSRRKWILIGAGAIFLGVFAAVPALRSRAASILDRSHHSNKERLHMWHAGWQLWKTHPLLGIGPGNVKQVSAGFQDAEERVWGPWGHLHSIYVNGLAERGLLGLLSFLIFVGALFWEVGRALRRTSSDPWRTAVLQATLLGMAGFLIGGLTEASYNTAVVMMTFYFVVGMALALTRHEETPRV
jgi:hypothetical protein